jgi:lysophospholipase L1-like esterase
MRIWTMTFLGCAAVACGGGGSAPPPSSEAIHTSSSGSSAIGEEGSKPNAALTPAATPTATAALTPTVTMGLAPEPGPNAASSSPHVVQPTPSAQTVNVRTPSSHCLPVAAGNLSRDIVIWSDSMGRELGSQDIGGRNVRNASVGGEDSTAVATRVLSDVSSRNRIVIIWMGTANWYIPRIWTWQDVAQVREDLAAVVNCVRQTQRRILILPVMNLPHMNRQTEEYRIIAAINAQSAKSYPDNFVDARGHVINNYDRNNPADVAAFESDVPPPSLLRDGVHLNERGNLLVRQLLSSSIAARGW